MKKLLVSVFFFAMLQSGVALAEPTLRAKVALLLSQRHGAAAKERWVALGPEARQLLLELAADPGLFPFHRSRALAALAYFPGPDVELVMRSVLESSETLPSVRRTAVEIYARVYPETAPTVLGPLLLEGDADLRLLTERVLSEIDEPAPPR